ncbi:hypothetical protein TFLX_05704 [Thermoflexales bacterium]|nr:hypothetical protein TFLX_05704 [Thermoflexales bacterium]
MSNPNDTTVDVTAGTTANGAVTTSQQPAVDWENDKNPYKEYKARFNGLQGKVQQLTNEHDGLKLKHGDLEEKHTKLTGEFEARGIELTNLTKKHDEATTSSKALQAKYERLQTVVTQFPDLAPFLGKDEASDLLPTGTGDELKTKLAAFREAMKQQGLSAAKDLIQGSTDGGATEQKPKAKEELLQLAIKAQRDGKMDEYDHYYSEYLKA